MDYEVVVFDTAPTGHTLRLLNFPKIMEQGLEKMVELKNKFSGVMNTVKQMIMAGQEDSEDKYDKAAHRLEETKKVINKIKNQMQDPVTSSHSSQNFEQAKTTFVAVCIPEFLSMYETERLMEELMNQEIDIRNIIVNQLIYPRKGTHKPLHSELDSRQQMQVL